MAQDTPRCCTALSSAPLTLWKSPSTTLVLQKPVQTCVANRADNRCENAVPDKPEANAPSLTCRQWTCILMTNLLRNALKGAPFGSQGPGIVATEAKTRLVVKNSPSPTPGQEPKPPIAVAGHGADSEQQQARGRPITTHGRPNCRCPPKQSGPTQQVARLVGTTQCRRQ